MIKTILRSKNPKLRDISKVVTKLDKKAIEIIKDLHDTLRAQKDPEGIGLAAPQIGKNVRIFLMRDNNVIKTVINPEITEIFNTSKHKNTKVKNKVMEGCLSLPHFYSPLTRSISLTLKYKNEKWEDVTESFSDLSAQIVQHEVDHLNGILFIDHVIEQKLPLYEFTKDGEWQKVELV